MRVFITGASSGIGAALAARYARAGAQLGLVARRADLLHSLAAGLPGEHRLYPLDVTDTPALRAAALDFLAGGVPEVVIANAGVSAGTLTEYVKDQVVFKRILDTNLLAMVATFEPFIEAMRDAAQTAPGFQARLVGVASVAGVRGLPGSGAYCASKAAVISYCESLRLELRGSGIRVVTLMPGFVATPMTANNPYPMPFLMKPEVFARQAQRAIAAGASRRVIPWQMAVVATLLRALPDWLYDRAFARAQRKPRVNETAG